METNTPVWQYYNEGFVDPLYVPYNRIPVKYDPSKFSSNSSQCYDDDSIEINTWKRNGYPDGMTNPYLVRMGWGNSFQLKFPEDPCPYGYRKNKYNEIDKNLGNDKSIPVTGWCEKEDPEYEPVFYTNKSFIPQNQYFDSYTKGSSMDKRKISEQTDMRSVNPITGLYTIYYDPVNRNRGTQYGRLPSRDSLL